MGDAARKQGCAGAGVRCVPVRATNWLGPLEVQDPCPVVAQPQTDSLVYCVRTTRKECHLGMRGVHMQCVEPLPMPVAPGLRAGCGFEANAAVASTERLPMSHIRAHGWASNRTYGPRATIG